MAAPTKRPILVAVDFSACSENALLWAADAADCVQAPLLVVHVVHDPESAPGYYRQSRKRKKHLGRMEEVAAEMLAEFLRRLRKKHPRVRALESLKTRLVVGLPVHRILELAESSGARLIVMGSQGRTGLPALLLGSKALKVAQLAPVPVTIVKQPEAQSKKRRR